MGFVQAGRGGSPNRSPPGGRSRAAVLSRDLRRGERLYNIVVACRAEAERRWVDLARPVAAINTGLQPGGGACEHGLSRLNSFWFATSACTSLKRGVSDIGGISDSTLWILRGGLYRCSPRRAPLQF